MNKRLVWLLSGSLTTLVATGAALFLYTQRLKRLAIKQQRDEKLLLFEREIDFCNECLIKKSNYHNTTEILKRIQEFIATHYPAPQIPSFHLLSAISEILLHNSLLNMEETMQLHEDLAVKTLNQMKEYINRRRRAMRQQQQELQQQRQKQTGTTKATTATATTARTEEVQDPYEVPLEEQEFQVSLLNAVVNGVMLSDDNSRLPMRAFQSMRKEIMASYKQHPHIPRIILNYAGVVGENLVLKRVLKELTEKLSKEENPKKHMMTLGRSYFLLGQATANPEEAVKLYTKGLECYPCGSMYMARYKRYREFLSKLPEEKRAQYAEYATDDERAKQHFGDRKELLETVRDFWKDEETFSKYYDQFLEEDMDASPIMIQSFYMYHVYKHGDVSKFLELLMKRLAYYEQTPHQQKTAQFLQWVYFFQCDALLHRLDFDKAMKLMQQLIDSTTHNNNWESPSSKKAVESLVEVIAVLKRSFARFPVLQEVFYKAKERTMAGGGRGSLSEEEFIEMFKGMETPADDHQALLEITASMLFCKAAWKSNIKQKFCTEAVIGCYQDKNVRRAIEKAQFTRGHYLFCMLKAGVDAADAIISGTPLDDVVEMVIKASREEIELEKQLMASIIP